MEISIRQANRSDAEIIIGFQENMALETESIILDNKIICSGVYAVFDDPSRGRYYVACSESKVLASLLITYEWSDWRNCYIWWFQSVFIMPEYRRRGIFKQMYEFIRDKACNEGIGGLRLYVELNNKKAQKTYEAMGMCGEHYKMYEWLKE